MGVVEQWVIIEPDGKLTLHTETDGPSVLRHGIEKWDEPITWDELQRRHPRLYQAALSGDVEKRHP